MSRPCLYSREDWKQIRNPNIDEGGQLRHDLYSILADCTRFMGERDRVIAANDKAARRSLVEEVKSALAELEIKRGDYMAFNQKHMDKPVSSLALELNIANHECATIFMLYNAAKICLLELLNTLEPSPHYISLRNSAALKIIHCLEVKSFEKTRATSEANTIGFVATKVAWQALGGFSSPEGRKLARVVKRVVNGVFAVGAWDVEPWKEPRVQTSSNPNAPSPVPSIPRSNASPQSVQQPEALDSGGAYMPGAMLDFINVSGDLKGAFQPTYIVSDRIGSNLCSKI